MNNLLNRDEFLNEELNIRGAVRKGFEKVKNAFKYGFAKVKNFIALFDKDGNVQPVTSSQAAVDSIVNNKPEGVNVAAGAGLNEEIKSLGGTAAPEQAQRIEHDSEYMGPNGKAWAKWVEEGEYQDSQEFRNMQALPKIIADHYNCPYEDAVLEAFSFFGLELDESKEYFQNRVHYSNTENDKQHRTGIDSFATITSEGFKQALKERIDWYVTGEAQGMSDPMNPNKKTTAPKNLLIFGAPGIGKSTIPDIVVNAFNEGKADADKIALITVSCARINAGELMMPSMPQSKDVLGYIAKNKDSFPNLAGLEDMTDDEKTQLQSRITNASQTVAPESPKSWLPVYKYVKNDDELNYILDTVANGGVQTTDVKIFSKLLNKEIAGKKHTTTGSGGIILFDELLRANDGIFNELMNFLLDRHVEDWYLGSKWFIIACSNRPCDDKKCYDTWKEMGAAARGRWAEIYHMEPEPEQWKAWAESKGMEKAILRYIFDENAMDGKEYYRWHSVPDKQHLTNDDENGMSAGVDPRRWEAAWGKICNYELKNGYDTIFDIPANELETLLDGVFEKGMRADFINWIDEHSAEVNLEDVINDPVGTLKPKGEPVIVVNTLWDQFYKKYTSEKYGYDIPDEDLKNVLIWLGINYARHNHVVDNNFIWKVEPEILHNKKSKNPSYLSSKTESTIVLTAAWPMEDDLEDMKSGQYDDVLGEKCYDRCIEYMDKYFPWRHKNDNVQYIENENDEEQTESQETPENAEA